MMYKAQTGSIELQTLEVFLTRNDIPDSYLDIQSNEVARHRTAITVGQSEYKCDAVQYCNKTHLSLPLATHLAGQTDSC